MTLIYVIIAITIAIINNCDEDYGDDSSEDGWNHIENFVNGTCMRARVVAQWCPTLLGPLGLSPARLLRPWDFSGKNTGVGFHFHFQGTFPSPGLTMHLLCLLHCR